MEEFEPGFRAQLPEGDLVSIFEKMPGETYRAVAERRTFRFLLGESAYFAKVHGHTGWLEILKNLFQFRLPIVSAANEREAIRALNQIGINTPQVVAYGNKGLNPASRRSVIVTRDLGDTASLETLFLAEKRVSTRVKRKIITEVASIARTMHGAGINHRDFYLCHFHLDRGKVPTLFLIDLHRAQIRKRTPRRWQVKDVGGLLYSALEVPEDRFTCRDLFRFMAVYSNKPFRQTLSEDRIFWREVYGRCAALYLQDHNKLPDRMTRLKW